MFKMYIHTSRTPYVKAFFNINTKFGPTSFKLSFAPPKEKAATLWLKTQLVTFTIDYLPQCLNNKSRINSQTYLYVV